MEGCPSFLRSLITTREPNRLNGSLGAIGGKPFVPEDPQSEEALLGCILLDPRRCMPIAEKIVRPRDFTREATRLTFEAMLDLWHNDQPLDFRTVESALRKPLSYGPGSQWLVGLMENVPTVANGEAYATRVRYAGTARDIMEAAGEIMHVAVTYDSSNADWNPETLVAKAVEPLEKLVEARGGGRVQTSDDVAHDYFATMIERRSHDPAAVGYELGFPELDKVMSYKRGELIYIAGAPSSGKTGFMGSLADALVDRAPAVPTLFVSIEQPLPQLMDRIVAHRSGIDSLRLAKGWISDDEARAVEHNLGELAKRPLYFVKEGSLTTAGLDAHVQFAIARYGVKVVFVDYAQIMADKEDEDMVRRIGFISGRLRQIAKRYNITLVVGSQVNAEDKLRWARELEQDAFVILLLKREANKETTSVQILKNRNGPSGHHVTIYFESRTAHFSPRATPRDEAPI